MQTAVKPMAPKVAADKQASFGDWGDRPIISYRQAAGFIGDFCEDLVERLLGVDKLRTLSGHFCPDLRKDEDLFECKAMRHRGETLLTIDQIGKYEAVKEEFNVIYAFIIHRVKANRVKSTDELYRKLSRAIDEVYLIDAEIVHNLRKRRKVETTNKLYRPFIRCRHTDLEKWFKRKGEGITHAFGVKARGREIEPFPVYLISRYAGRVVHMENNNA